MEMTTPVFRDHKLHCPECGDIVFKQVAGQPRTVECTTCQHQMVRK
ncbi:hypothetical protein [Levilactobacillus zymae]|nr:hypothetical protein [Levilactobacillus zymae]